MSKDEKKGVPQMPETVEVCGPGGVTVVRKSDLDIYLQRGFVVFEPKAKAASAKPVAKPDSI